MNACVVWKATNVQKANSRHNSITHELETVQEELEQARLNNIQAFLGKQQKNNSEKTSKNGEKAQKSTEIKRKSSFSKPKNTSQNSNNSPGKKVVVFNRKIAVSQPSVVSSFQVVQNGGAEVPKNLKLKSKIAPRPPSFSTSSLDTKYARLAKIRKWKKKDLFQNLRNPLFWPIFFWPIFLGQFFSTNFF